MRAEPPSSSLTRLQDVGRYHRETRVSAKSQRRIGVMTTPEMEAPPPARRAALEHRWNVGARYGRTFARSATARGRSGFQPAVEDGDREARRDEADRGDQEGRHTEQPEPDQRDSEGHQDGGVEPVSAASLGHRPRREITPGPPPLLRPSRCCKESGDRTGRGRRPPLARPQRAKLLYEDQAGFGFIPSSKSPEPSQKLQVPGESVNENQ